MPSHILLYGPCMAYASMLHMMQVRYIMYTNMVCGDMVWIWYSNTMYTMIPNIMTYHAMAEI